jgi:transposase
MEDMAYSIDYKERAVEYKDAGHTFEELKEAFKIPPITYYDWKEKLESGYFDKKFIRQRNRKIDREKLRQAVKENPDAYLHELAQQFDCTPQAVFYMLLRLGITLKKRPLPTVKNLKKNALSLSRS